MKTIVTLLLASAISASHSFAQTPPPPDMNTNRMELVGGCIALVVGGVVLIGINHLCNRVLPPTTNAVAPPPAQPHGLIQRTNDDGTIVCYPHNHKPGDTVAIRMNADINATDVTEFHFGDMDSGTTNQFFGMWALEIQSSTGNGWTSACTITGWVSKVGSRFDWYQGGTNATATYAPAGMPGHYGNVDLGFDAPHRMFRLKNCLAR